MHKMTEGMAHEQPDVFFYSTFDAQGNFVFSVIRFSHSFFAFSVLDTNFSSNSVFSFPIGNNTSGADYFAETSSAYDAANIATFGIENTGVEWKYTAGYRDGAVSYTHLWTILLIGLAQMGGNLK